MPTAISTLSCIKVLVLSPEKLLLPRCPTRLPRGSHLSRQLADERLKFPTDHIVPLWPGLNTMLSARGPVIRLISSPTRVDHRAVVPPSVESALPENVRESNPDPTGERERCDGGGDQRRERVLLLLVVHGGQGAPLLHAHGERVQPVERGGGELPALGGRDLGVSDRASSDKRGYCCADGGGGGGRRHCGGRRGRWRGQAGGGGGCCAGDWSTSTSEDSTLDRALCRTLATSAGSVAYAGGKEAAPVASVRLELLVSILHNKIPR